MREAASTWTRRLPQSCQVERPLTPPRSGENCVGWKVGTDLSQPSSDRRLIEYLGRKTAVVKSILKRQSSGLEPHRSGTPLGQIFSTTLLPSAPGTAYSA